MYAQPFCLNYLINVLILTLHKSRQACGEYMAKMKILDWGPYIALCEMECVCEGSEHIVECMNCEIG